MKSINPYNSQVVFENPAYTAQQVEQAINTAHTSFQTWRTTTFEERSDKMLQLAIVLEQNKEKYAQVMTLEMGKPISQAIAEVEKCAWVCRYYADNAQQQLQPKHIKTDAQASYVRFDPLGIILGVMPWNYPFWQVFRFAVPTLMAGNTALLKHASNVMESSKMIQQAFDEAGFPTGVFAQLTIGSDRVESILRNPKVKGVSLTGSKPAGASVASVASQEIKPSLLELGGNNALVVFDDCNVNATLETVINARFQNTGQSCIAGKRLFLQENIAEKFLNLLSAKIRTLKSGNPTDNNTFIGTMVNAKAAEELNNQLQNSLEMGAKLVVGGNFENAYFEPTLVTNVNNQMPIYKEETFGPLLACSTFKTDEDALKMVNESDFGLGVSIFTQDKNRIEKLIPLFEDGAVFINELVKSDPRLPFGGTKISGYGRELSQDGIMAFVNKKTVFIK